MISAFSKSFSNLMSYIGNPDDRRTVVYCTVMSIVATGLFYTIPYLCGHLLNRLVKMYSGDYDYDYVFVVSLCALLVLIVVFWYVATSECRKRMAVLALDTTKRMRVGLHDKMLKVPPSYIESVSPGDLTARFTNDLPAVSRLISKDSTGFVVYSTMVVAILFMMMVTSPYLGILYIILLPITLSVGYYMTRASEKDMGEQRERISELNSMMSDIITSHRIVKNEMAGDVVLEEFAASDREFTKAYVSTKMRSAFIGPLTAMVTNIGYLLTVIIGSVLIINGMLQIGMFMSFMIYVRLVSAPLSSSAEVYNRIRDEAISLDRVLEVLEAPEEEVIEDSSEPFDLKGDIVFEDVDFSYGDKKALDSLSFTVKAGEITALVGPTGSGKTTAASLIIGYHTADSGRVTVDGRDVSLMSRKDISRHMAAVLQKPWLFDGTIRENIVYTNTGAKEEDMLRYSKLTGLDDFVRTLPEGYDTKIGTDLNMLPLAQCRMVALTRAFLYNPEIMVLDEAVAGIDPVSGQSILDGLRSEFRGRTVILITHNPALIRQADRVVRIEDGRCTGCTAQ